MPNSVAEPSPSAGRAPQRTAIIVAGMHRSGTSALARVLNLLGCGMARDLVKANFGNTLGYWESRSIVELNSSILAELNANWMDWTCPGFDGAKSIIDKYRQRAERILEEEYGSSSPFVIKDPRKSLLLRFWNDVFNNVSIKPLVIISLRNPLNVAASLEKRDGLSFSHAQLLWLRYLLEAEGSSRNVSRMFISFDALLTDWRREIERLSQGLGLEWPRAVASVESEVDSFLSTSHRHHDADDEEIAADGRVLPWVRSSFAIFRRWAHGGDAAASACSDWAELDRIRSGLDVSASLFPDVKSLYKEIDAKNLKIRHQQYDIEDLQRIIAERDAEIARLRDRLQAILNSTSWRATSPLRALMGHVRNLRRVSGR